MQSAEVSSKGIPCVCGGDPDIVSVIIDDIVVFPAYAGVILVYDLAKKVYKGIPCVCGGDP